MSSISNFPDQVTRVFPENLTVLYSGYPHRIANSSGPTRTTRYASPVGKIVILRSLYAFNGSNTTDLTFFFSIYNTSIYMPVIYNYRIPPNGTLNMECWIPLPPNFELLFGEIYLDSNDTPSAVLEVTAQGQVL